MKETEEEKMENLKEAAVNYVPPTTRNIAELEKVPVNVEIREESFTKEDGEQFSIKKITVDGEDYKVPVMVLKQLKEILKEIPNLEFFKVNKTGSGLSTSYTTIPK